MDLIPSEAPGEGLLQGVGGALPCRDRQSSRVTGERGWAQGRGCLAGMVLVTAGSVQLGLRRPPLLGSCTCHREGGASSLSPQPQEPGNVWEREELGAQVSAQTSLPFQMQAHPQSPGSPPRRSPTWKPLPGPAP